MIWFIIVIILAVLLIKARRELRELHAQKVLPPGATLAKSRLNAAQQDLIVLRLELRRRLKAGEIDPAFYQQITEQIDAQWAERFEKAWVDGDFRRQACQRAWNQLAARGRVPSGPLPWERSQPVPASQREPAAPSFTEPEVVAAPMPPTPVPTVAPSEPPLPSPAPLEAASPESDYAWQPQPPGALEKALHTLAGWPKVLLPFLVQNIGWFIGGFCFLAGAIFLVSYTSGFTKGLVVFAALFAFTLALLWSGYRFRLRQPALETGSTVLLTLGTLLIPLNLSVLVRLLVTADSGWLMVVSLLAMLLALALFIFATQVISGIMDRTLQGQQPRLYLALASVQLTLPLLARWPTWPPLALLHVLLLGLLAYGLWRYAHDWMQAIFVERRRIAWFAAGTLLYAALISFIHLTWGVPLAVPTGYYAPYLMAVCGLLFYLDTQFQEWVQHHTFLSRFSFLIYGLSVLAVVLAWDAPLAHLLTLALGAVLYGAVAWYYLTLIPLCLLLACLGGIYSQLVLSYFPAAQHFLWSLPGLAGIWALSRWTRNLAERRSGAYPLALLSYRLLTALIIALTGWSLYHAEPGWTAMATALLAAGSLWWLFGSAPGPLLSEPVDERPTVPLDLRDSPWLYTVVLMITAAAALAPAWIDLPLEGRFALELMLLAWLWAWLALWTPTKGGLRLMRTEVFANSALLNIFAGLGIALGLSLEPSGRNLLILLFGLGAVPLLWLSLGLYVRWLFYGFLLLAAGAAVLVKLLLFPGPSSGGVTWLAGLGIWTLLWWLNRQPAEAEAEALTRSRIPRPLILLGIIPLPELNTGAGEETQDWVKNPDV